MKEDILFCTRFSKMTAAEDIIKMVISPYKEEGFELELMP